MTNYELLLNTENFAVIGINPDAEKFAHKIYTLLKSKNKTTYGINHKYPEIDGERMYASILDIPSAVDIAVMVVNPKIGITLIDDIKAKGVTTLWLQPGTISEELLEKAASVGLNVVQDCVLRQYHQNS